jgi:hypothetical protein
LGINDAATNFIFIPIINKFLPNITHISAGGYNSFVIGINGVYVFGDNDVNFF